MIVRRRVVRRALELGMSVFVLGPVVGVGMRRGLLRRVRPVGAMRVRVRMPVGVGVTMPMGVGMAVDQVAVPMGVRVDMFVIVGVLVVVGVIMPRGTARRLRLMRMIVPKPFAIAH
jgi:hypothetical protein